MVLILIGTTGCWRFVVQMDVNSIVKWSRADLLFLMVTTKRKRRRLYVRGLVCGPESLIGHGIGGDNVTLGNKGLAAKLFQGLAYPDSRIKHLSGEELD